MRGYCSAVALYCRPRASDSSCRSLRARRSSSFFFSMPRPPLRSTLFPYTTLFRSCPYGVGTIWARPSVLDAMVFVPVRSEEHTSELQSRLHLVCRLLLEKKKRSRYGSV